MEHETAVLNFSEIIPKFDAILARGLCTGVGDRDGQMCIEAAICAALDLPHGDEPICVEPAVRSFKIHLNDSPWTSPEARAKGLRDLGIAQIGSKGVVDGREFAKCITERTIRVLIPALFREVFPKNKTCLEAADRCEKEGTSDSAAEAAAWAARAAEAAAWAAWAAEAAEAAEAAAWAAEAAKKSKDAPDKYLLMSAGLALEVLRELKSTGAEWV